MTTLISPGLERKLRRQLQGDVFFDAFSRGRYASDASIYQMMPRGVVVPKSTADVEAALTLAREEGTAVLPRGGGTSQCGQTVNDALVIDNSKHLTRILELDVEGRRCVVEPGIVLDTLNRALKPHGLWFPVDVSTASRATIGGMAANNSCGGRSIRYGRMRENVLSIEALLADGTKSHFGSYDCNIKRISSPVDKLNQDMLALGARDAEEIKARFPDLLRRVGGYNLDALMPNASNINLAHLLVGSEGTLAYSTAIELKLSAVVTNRVIGVCHFPSFYQAMAATQHLVTLNPQAVELIDDTMIALAREIDIFRPVVEQFVRGAPAALLLVEFGEDSQNDNLQRLQDLRTMMGDLGFSWRGVKENWGGVIDAVDLGLQNAIAEVRKSGLNIMMSMKADGKPVSFVEDCAVALPDLAEFTQGLTDIFGKHGTKGTWYAHASVGCLHVRPVLNLKLDRDVKAMRAIAEEAFELVRKYKGSHSGEHGDGIVRSEFHEKMFGPRLVASFAEVKQRFDPDQLFNPNRIVDPPKMDDRSYFRYGPNYRVEAFETELDWSSWPGAGGGFQGAVEMCNNNGACRKLTGGGMCPSYRVTLDERDLTRGRANSLRLAISGQLGPDAFTSKEMADTLKLCVSCKACRRECPTGVDMARMKIEVLAARAKKHGVSLHDRLVAYLPRYAPYAVHLPAVMNLRNRVPGLAKWLESPTGFSAKRLLPSWRRDFFRNRSGDYFKGEHNVVLFADTFNRYFEPDNLHAAIKLLRASGYGITVAAAKHGRRPLCCGRTFLSAGLVDQARAEAQRTIDALLPLAKRGEPIIGLEPSCLLTLRDEFKGLIPGEEAKLIASKAVMLEEFLAREVREGKMHLRLKPPAPRLLVHGHCHQKAFDVMDDMEAALRLIPGVNLEVVQSGCCGMAGAFGYAAQTHEISMQMGELGLLPAVRAAGDDTMIVANGTSCRHQVRDGTGRKALHIAQVLAMSLVQE